MLKVLKHIQSSIYIRNDIKKYDSLRLTKHIKEMICSRFRLKQCVHICQKINKQKFNDYFVRIVIYYWKSIIKPKKKRKTIQVEKVINGDNNMWASYKTLQQGPIIKRLRVSQQPKVQNNLNFRSNGHIDKYIYPSFFSSLSIQ